MQVRFQSSSAWASIPLVETLNLPGFTLDSTSDRCHRDAILCSALLAEEPVKLLLLPVFSLILSTSHKSIQLSLISAGECFPTLLACYHANIQRCERFCLFSWFRTKAELTWPLASRWVMGPLGITFGPTASFVVGHLNLWVSTKIPLERLWENLSGTWEMCAKLTENLVVHHT